MESSYKHILTGKIISKVLMALRDAYGEGQKKTQDELAEMCGVSQKHINRLLHGKFGDKFTLDMALSIWEGIGNPPETLVGGYWQDDLLLRKIQGIQTGSHVDIFNWVVEILSNCDLADPLDLAKLRGFLRPVRAKILTKKNQEVDSAGEES